MTYKELYESAIDKLEKSKITLGEFEKMIAPLNAEIATDSDTISRQAAIKALDKRFDSIPMEQTTEILLLRRDLRELPPTQPERIKGHWIESNGLNILMKKFIEKGETWRTMQGYRQDGEFMFWYNGRLESALDNEHRVSAWMPLPEPYKGVTE